MATSGSSRTIRAHAAPAAGSELELMSIDMLALGDDDVVVDISHCGVCGTDLHLIDNYYRTSSFPLIPGHEIIGTIVEVGSPALSSRIGERVGVGYHCGACFDCAPCSIGEDSVCKDRVRTVGTHTGGFADRIKVDHRCAHRIPDDIDSAHAAPLFCAGATSYAALQKWAKPASRVGVVGVGGVGHLAIQYAAAMGHEVTAFTSSPRKAEEARRFGAHDILSSVDPAVLAANAARFDLILYTADRLDHPKETVGLLRANGCLCFLAAMTTPTPISAAQLVGWQVTVTGQMTSGQALMPEMLAFTAEHGIEALVETLPMDQAKDALQRVADGKAHYRLVLVR